MNVERILDLLRQITRYCAYLGGASLLVCVVMTTADVFSRRFLGTTLRGTIELTQLSVLWAAFLCIPLGFAYGNHIAVTVFTDGFSTKFKRALRGSYMLIGALVMLCYAYFCSFQFMETIEAKEISTNIGLPLWLFWIPIIVGLCLSFVCALVAAFSIYRGTFVPHSEVEI